MNEPLRILHLEDSLDDAELIRRKLLADGLDCRIVRVEDRRTFAEQLAARPGFDLILSDFTIPSFDGRAALAMAREAAPDTPFLFVSGTIGEDMAVECLREGATDYVLKTAEMRRLAPAVRRALSERRERAERKRLEDQYRQAQKMEAVGRLAGGVAHDFNNLLTAILGHAELSMLDLPPGKVKEDLREIVATTMRGAQLTRQLLTFSRKSIATPLVLDLNDALRNVEKLLKRVIGEDTAFAFRPGPGLPPVFIDPSQLEQLVVNLSVNARDAMPQGGTVTMETSAAAPSAELLTRRPAGAAAPSGWTRLSIRDTGVGISPEVRAHLFEPFFTTKETGKGTGLGLATCYGIVQQAGGLIDVISEPGRGAEFAVYLPAAADGVPASRRNIVVGEDEGPSGSELILIVEDEIAVRRLAMRVLRSRGYEVLEAADAADALRLIEQDRDRRVRLVLTDVVMPGMSGSRLAERLSEKRPDLKILFTSGYADEELGRHGVLPAGVRFLPKPFTMESLSQKVRDTLDEKA